MARPRERKRQRADDPPHDQPPSEFPRLLRSRTERDEKTILCKTLSHPRRGNRTTQSTDLRTSLPSSTINYRRFGLHLSPCKNSTGGTKTSPTQAYSWTWISWCEAFCACKIWCPKDWIFGRRSRSGTGYWIQPRTRLIARKDMTRLGSPPCRIHHAEDAEAYSIPQCRVPADDRLQPHDLKTTRFARVDKDIMHSNSGSSPAAWRLAPI